MNLELNIVKFKRGYRWRVYKDGNLFCTGTDYHKRYVDAEREAIETFCKPWDIINRPNYDA